MRLRVPIVRFEPRPNIAPGLRPPVRSRGDYGNLRPKLKRGIIWIRHRFRLSGGNPAFMVHPNPKTFPTMLRAILSVVAGYTAMFLTLFLSFSAAYLAMGTESAFQPGSYEVSFVWIIISFVLGLAAAVIGGWLCAVVSRGSKAPSVLAGIVLVLGALMVFPVLRANREASPPRTADVPNLEAMSKARQPTWIAIANPLLGCVGVLLGARLRRDRPAQSTP